MTLADLLLGVMFVGLIAYGLFGGADFGAGLWYLLAGPGRRLRNESAPAVDERLRFGRREARGGGLRQIDADPACPGHQAVRLHDR